MSSSIATLFTRLPDGGFAAACDDDVITLALALSESRMSRPQTYFSSPDSVKAHLCLQLGSLPHEVFGVMFFDSQNGLLCFEDMFRGSLSQTSVFPREVVKRALALNCAGVVFAHNHPGGGVTPSRADESLTLVLKNALALVDVRVLDHVIVSGNRSLSMAEQGLL